MPSASATPSKGGERKSAQTTQSGKAAPQANPSPSPAQQMPTVIVTATRFEQPISEIGTSVTVFDGQQIESQKIQRVNDALRQVPGLTVTQQGSPGTISEASIRGATAAQTLTLIDGVEVNTGSNGGFDLATLTTDNLDRIEVVRGAGGALYGSQAVGGVINFISKEGQGPPRFTFLSEGGSRATQRQAMTFEGSQGQLGYSGAMSYFSTTGFRPINDSHDNLSGNLRLDYHLDEDTTLRGFARYIRSNTSLVDFSNTIEPLDPNAHQRNEFMLYNGEIEHRFGEKLAVRANAFFVRNELRLNNLPDRGNPSFEVDRIPEETRGGNIEAAYEWCKGFRTLAGFDFKDRGLRSLDEFRGFGFISNTVFRSRRQEYAGYVEQEATLLDGHLIGTAGFRADGNSNFGEEVSPTWAVAIPLWYGVTMRGSYSEGFRAPSFDELFFPDFGNPKLKPEISSEYDGGVTQAVGELASFTATYFSRRVHRLIVPVTIATNIGHVDVQGVELAPMLHAGRDFTLGGNFTVIDETHRPLGPVRPTRVPKHSASALAQYTHGALLRPADNLALSLVYTFVGDRDDLDPMSSAIRSHTGYHRFDAVASYAPGIRWGEITDVEIFTRVQNLFDRRYFEAIGFKAPPINAVAGVRLGF